MTYGFVGPARRGACGWGAALLAFVLAWVPGSATAQTIITFAGGANNAPLQENVPATQQSLSPRAIAMGPDGYLYVAEPFRGLVRRISPAGVINTFAGNGTLATTGDGGPALSAGLNGPVSLAFDNAGNLLIGCEWDYVIRKVTPAGIISTVAGIVGSTASTGSGGPASAASLAFPSALFVAPEGSVYVSERYGHRVRRIDPQGVIHEFAGNGSFAAAKTGPATGVPVPEPGAVAMDSLGRVYITTGTNYPGTVRVELDGTAAQVFNAAPAAWLTGPAGQMDFTTSAMVTRFRAPLAPERLVGTGSAGFGGDGGLALDATLGAYLPGLARNTLGELYIADFSNSRIRKVTIAAPSAPSAPVAMPGNQQARVRIAYPQDNGGPVTSFTVVATPGGPVDLDAGSPNLEHTLSGLTNGTSYTFRASATNVAGTSALSSPSNPVTPVPVPGPPTLIVAELTGAGEVTLEFTPPLSPGGAPITGYSIRTNPSGGVDAAAGSMSLVRRITGLPKWGSFSFAVVANNSYGAGLESNRSADIAILPVPGPVEVRGVNFDAFGATVSFNPPVDDGGSPVTDYTGTVTPTGAAPVGGGTNVTTRYFSNLATGTDYTFTIRARNEFGWGTKSAPFGPVHRIFPPGKPAIASIVPGDGTLTVTIQSGGYDGGSPITRYDVVALPAAGADTTPGSPNLVHVLAGLTNGQVYGIRVFATNLGGQSEASDIVNAVPAAAPSQPLAPTARAGEGRAFLRITPPDSNFSPIIAYTIESQPAGGIDLQAGTAALDREIGGLVNGATYRFRVSAANQVGASPFSPLSNPVKPTAGRAPGAPLMGPTFKFGRGATVNFNTPADPGTSPILGYNVRSIPAGGTDLDAGSLALAHRIVGLTDGVAYSFTATAINNLGQGAESAPSATVTPGALSSPMLMAAAGGELGDSRAPSGASLNAPGAVASDSDGNLYIADRANHRIRRISAEGRITTVAGKAGQPVSGDGGPAVAARLLAPFAIAVSAAGELYIADTGNQRVRKVGTDGTIQTIAGNGVSASNGDGGPATAASLASPAGVAVDSLGNVFVSEFAGHRVRKVSAAGQIVTVAGTGVASAGGDGGPAASASLNSPLGLSVDANGNLFVADYGNHAIRMVDAGSTISRLIGLGYNAVTNDGPVGSIGLSFPTAVHAFGPNDLYFVDETRRARRLLNGNVSTLAGALFVPPEGQGEGGPADQAALWNPSGITRDSMGNLVFAELEADRVRRVTPAGVLEAVGGPGYSGDGGEARAATLARPAGVAFDSSGRMYIADRRNNRVRRVDLDGRISTLAGGGLAGNSGIGGPATAALLNDPTGVAVDSKGVVYIVDRGNKMLKAIGTDGILRVVAGDTSSTNSPYLIGFGSPFGVAVDAADDVYVADQQSQRVYRFRPNISAQVVAGGGIGGDGGLATEAMLSQPTAVVVSAAGEVYFTDVGTHRVRKVALNGIISTVAGTGVAGYNGDNRAAAGAALAEPAGLAFDEPGNLYISEALGARVRKVSNGVITTVAGLGSPGYGGEGDLASNSSLSSPLGLARGTDGNIYIADAGNHRVRAILAKLAPPGAPLHPQAAAGSASAQVRFDPPASPGSRSITGYVVESLPAGGIDLHAGSAATQHTVSGLQNGTSYRFRVQASSEAGVGAWSHLSNAVVPYAQTLSISNVSMTEGDAGSKLANFVVSRSSATGAVSFDIATANGTAFEGDDYVARQQLGATMGPGQASFPFQVTITGDVRVERDEGFVVNVTNVVGATPRELQGRGTIGNDDQPTLSVADASASEGSATPGAAVFHVTLSSPATTLVTFQVATADVTATAGSDYVARAPTQVGIDPGRSSARVEIALMADALPEATETFSLQVLQATGATIADGVGVGSILDDDGAASVPIAEIQGKGSASPLLGRQLATEGIVTARTDAGLFIQSSAEGEDGDSDTSEGLFVATDRSDAILVGTRIRVEGWVEERMVPDFSEGSLTSLRAIRTITIASNLPLPPPVELNAERLSANDAALWLERHEGMRVRLAPSVVVGPSGRRSNPADARIRTDGRFVVVPRGMARPVRSAAARRSAGGATQDGRLRIVSGGQRGTVALSADVNDELAPVSGVLSQEDAIFDFLPDPGSTPTLRSRAEPKLAPEMTGSQLRIANLHLSAWPKGTETRFPLRLAKTAALVCAFAGSPDIVAVTQEGDSLDLAELADALVQGDANRLFPGACPQRADYRFVSGTSPGHGFLVKVPASAPPVELVSVAGLQAEARFTHPDGSSQPLFDHPPQWMRVRVATTKGSHDLGLLSVQLADEKDPGTQPGPHGWASEGAFLRSLRMAQAASIARAIQRRQQLFPREGLIVLGNFGASEFEDVEGDLFGWMSGKATAPGGPSPVDPPLTNLTALLPSHERYTVVHKGEAHAVDHVLVNQALLSAVKDARVAPARADADFAGDVMGDASLPLGASDHDPQVLYLEWR